MAEFDIESVKRYLRNTISASPEIVYSPNVTDDTTVINIDTTPALPEVLWLDLDNGYTVRLTVAMYRRES